MKFIEDYKRQLDDQQRVAQYVDLKKFMRWGIGGGIAFALASQLVFGLFTWWLDKPLDEFTLGEQAMQAGVLLVGAMTWLAVVYFGVFRPAVIAAEADKDADEQEASGEAADG